jgi:hypothetical protein
MSGPNPLRKRVAKMESAARMKQIEKLVSEMSDEELLDALAQCKAGLGESLTDAELECLASKES